MDDIKCKCCGCAEMKYEKKDQHLGMYCTECGKWQKWVKQPGNEGKTKEYYRNDFLSKEKATDRQIGHIRWLLVHEKVNKLQASRIIDILGGTNE